MSNERELIRSAREVFGPATAAGATVRALCAALEKRLDGRSRPATDEQALRAEVDDNLTTTMLVWADAIEDEGKVRLAEGMRWLARQGKRPGAVGGWYRWMPDKPEFGKGASWALPGQLVRSIEAVGLTSAGRGRFKSLSSALLAAAGQVPLYLAWEADQKRQREQREREQEETALAMCECDHPCSCARPQCCNCGGVKRES